MGTSFGHGVVCPACGLRCVTRINADFAECPEHGVISGLLLLQVRSMEPWEALVEIRAAQLHDDLRRAFRRLETWLYNDSYLYIRMPTL